MKGYAMVNNSSKLNKLCFDTRIITFPSKEKGEFDQPNSLDLSLPVTYNRRYLTKLSVVKSDYFPFCYFFDNNSWIYVSKFRD